MQNTTSSPSATALQTPGSAVNTSSLMDVKQVAKLLNCSEATVTRLRSSGQLSFVRIGRQIRFHASDLAEYLALNHKPATGIA